MAGRQAGRSCAAASRMEHLTHLRLQFVHQLTIVVDLGSSGTCPQSLESGNALALQAVILSGAAERPVRQEKSPDQRRMIGKRLEDTHQVGIGGWGGRHGLGSVTLTHLSRPRHARGSTSP